MLPYGLYGLGAYLLSKPDPSSKFFEQVVLGGSMQKDLYEPPKLGLLEPFRVHGLEYEWKIIWEMKWKRLLLEGLGFRGIIPMMENKTE